MYMYEACPCETLAFYPENIDVDKRNSALLAFYKVILLYNVALTATTLIVELPYYSQVAISGARQITLEVFGTFIFTIRLAYTIGM